MKGEEWHDEKMAAWQRLFATGRADRRVVSPEVADSWERCLKAGLDPEAPKTPVRVTQQQLATIRRDKREFIEAALPFMQFLKIAVQGSGFILVLTDEHGIVLDVFGDQEIMRMARDNNYIPGCCRTEQEVGTNSIGLCLIEKKPIQTSGPDHYNLRHHSWTCASAPVFSPDNELLGAITLSGKSTSAHRHTLGMVISAAEAIQNKLKQQKTAREKSKTDTLVECLLTSWSEAIMAVNRQGIITHANSLASKLVAVPVAQLKGKSIQQLFPSNPELINLIQRGEPFSSREVALDSRQGRSYLMLRPFLIHGRQGVQGAILVLSERSRFFNIVRDVSGYNARFTFEDIKGHAPELKIQMDLARMAAGTDSRILIIGETGTGKELIAHAIHNASKRKSGPFVAINCAAIPRELIESEILGYKEGAFTGARKGGQVGKLELADGGTIFLDEVGEMPLDVQAKFLRVLEDSMITRLGDTRPVRVDVRVIAATNEDLFEKVASKDFRQDLYFRLSVVELAIPPLRERLCDLPELAEHILERIAQQNGGGRLTISEGVLQRLSEYHWPGNVRELVNVLERAAIVCQGGVIRTRDLPARLLHQPRPLAVGNTARSMRDFEAELLKNALEETGGNIAAVSRRLQISRSTVYRRMKQYGIDRVVSIR